MMRARLTFFIALVASCGRDEPRTPKDEPQEVLCDDTADGELVFPSSQNNGVFDASIAIAPDGRAWMAYSVVNRDAEGDDHVATRLASSDDGLTWCESVALGQTSAVNGYPAASWNNEVASLVFDAHAPIDERWKLFWHAYVLIGSERHFETGRILWRAAESPEGLASASDRPLVFDTWEELSDCVVLTEPGAVTHDDHLFLALQCQAVDQRIVVTELDRNSGAFVFRGAPIRAGDVEALSPLITGVAAPALVAGASASAGGLTLIVSPEVGALYGGCLAYALDISTFAVGSPLQVFAGAPAELTGACELDSALPALGLVVSQTTLLTQPVFHLRVPGVFW